METALEKVLITGGKEEMISWLNTHPKDFDEAVNLALTDKQPWSWRAAWLLGNCMEENDQRLRKHINDIINVLPAKKDGHQRELIKILYRLEIDESFEGQLFDHCIRLWEKINKQPSVRISALRMILKIARKYAELLPEIHFLTQSHYMETLSPGIRRSVHRLLPETAAQ